MPCQLAFVRFDQPVWLLFAAAAIVPVAIALLRSRRGGRISGPRTAVQCVAVVLVAIALSRPTAPLGGRAQKPWLILQDVSPSVTGQDEPPPWPDDIRSQTRTFGPASAGPPRTEAAPALRLAVARAEELAGVVIRTDGQFHDDWSRAANALGGTGLGVLIDPLDSPPADARVAELSARRDNGKVALRANVVANAPMRRELTVTRTAPDEETLLSRSLQLRPGEPATIRLSDDPPAESVARYKAELTPAGAFAENDSATASVLGISGTVTVISGEDAADPAELADRLNRTVEVLDPTDAPDTLDGWMNSDAVVLIDPTGTLLSRPQRAALAEAVRSGTGLVLIGAPPHRRAEDRNDPLSRVAALQPDPWQRNPLKVAVTLDISGSMGKPAGQTRRSMFDFAVEAMLGLRRHLTEHDALAVLTFADEPEVVYDSGDEPPDFAELRQAIAPIRPVGPTYVLPALERSREVLADPADAPARDDLDRLLIVVSDLWTEEFDTAEMARSLRDADISLAVVFVAPGDLAGPTAAPLELLAEDMDAPLVESEQLRDLAEIFERFIRDSRGPTVRRGDFTLSVAEGALAAPEFPVERLTAYLLCAEHPRADVLAAVGPDPVLARRRAGLGRSIGFAVPLEGEDNAHLADTEELTRLLAAAVEQAARPAGDPRFGGDVRWTDGRLRIRIEARDADGPVNNLDLSLQTAAPDETEPLSTPMRQTGPGVYEGEIDAPARTPAVHAVAGDGRVVWRRAIDEPTPPEFTAIGANWQNLRELAERTGGGLVMDGRVDRHVREATQRARTHLWPFLLAAALALMLGEWTAGRLAARRRSRSRTEHIAEDEPAA